MATATKARTKKTEVKDVAPPTKLDVSKVKVGDMMAVLFWVRVKEVLNGGQNLTVTDIDNKSDFEVRGASLVEKCLSADTYTKEEKVTKTAMAEKLVGAWNQPFTVVYEKADKTLRTLRGKLLETEPLMGRCYCFDFDITEGSPLRLVDLRTLQSLVLGNIKYILK